MCRLRMTQRQTQTMDKIERRFTLEPFQIRVADGDEGKTTISGRAVVYNAWTQIGPDSWGWKERIAPGALTDSLRDEGIYSTFNHRADNLLARVSNGTLRMTDGEKALMVEIDPNLDTDIGRQVLAFVKRQDVRGMSFSFSVDGGGYQMEYAKKKGGHGPHHHHTGQALRIGARDQPRIHPDIREVEKFGVWESD